MIKIMSNTIAKISYFVIFIITLTLLVYFLLLNGIKIKSITLPLLNIKRLYIKLDKKLIVKVDYLKIKKSYKKTGTKSQLLSIKNYLNYFYQFFKEVDIHKLQYKDQTVRLKYIYDRFFLDTDELYFLANISTINNSNIRADIKNLYLKKHQAYFQGKLNIYPNKIEFDGKFNLHQIKGFAKIDLKENILNYYIYDVRAKNIAPFMDFLNSKIKIEKEISNWIYRYIVAKDYRLHYMYGLVDIKTGEFFPKSIRAEATAKDAMVKFHKNLPNASVKKIDIKLKNNTLSFKLYRPTYKGVDLNGSKVTITNIFSSGAAIEVLLKADHPLDKKIKKILKAYNVDLPLYQKNSSTRSTLRIYIVFAPYSINISGDFFTKNSDIWFKNVKFHTKKAHISLHNNTIDLNNTNISYSNLFDINTTGIFNIKKDRYDGNIYINKLFLKYKNTILLNTLNKKSKIVINFKKGVVDIVDLDALLNFGKNNKFIFKDLKYIYPLSPFLKKYGIKQGDIKLYTKDFRTFNLKSHIFYDKNRLLLHNNQPIKEFHIKAILDNKDIKLDINNKILTVNIANQIKIKANNISYDVRELTKIKGDKRYYFNTPINIDSNNSTVYISDNITIPTSTFTLFLNEDKKIFSSVYGKNHIFYAKDSNIVTIDTNLLSAKYINTIIHHKLFNGGFFKLSIKEKNNLFEGNCKILGSKIKSQKKGGSDFKIDSGEFYFYLKDSMLNLTAITLTNKYYTLKGDGYIDLKNKKLYLIFDVTVLKDLGNTIKNIPLIGYILLGKNGKFTSKVVVSGGFDNPRIKTDFAKDVITSPLNMFFRVLKLPFSLFSPKN